MRIVDHLNSGAKVRSGSFADLIRIAMSKPVALKSLGFHPRSEPSRQEILKVYKNLALKHHPDRGGDPEKMQNINIAKDVLLGLRKPDFPSVEDYRPDPGVTYRSTEDEKKPPEPPKPPAPEIVTWNDAMRDAKVPTSGVTWKFRTNDSVEGAGKTTYVVYGKSPTKHIFVQVFHDRGHPEPSEKVSKWNKVWSKYVEQWENFKERAPDEAAKLDEPDENPPPISGGDYWKMQMEAIPGRWALEKVAPPILKKLGGHRWNSAGFFKEGTPFTQKTVHTWDFKYRPLENVLKMMRGKDPLKSKLKVVIELLRSLNGDPHVTLVINGREFRLSVDSGKMMEKAGILKKIWPEEKPGNKPVALVRGRSAKQVLYWMSQNLIREPDQLRYMLKAAGDQIKG